VLGGCSRCGKQYGGRNGNPLTHVCRPRDGDFRRRKTEQRRKARNRARAKNRADELARQREKLNAVRDRERRRSREQIDRLKRSYQQRLRDERAKNRQPHKAPPKSRPRRPTHEYQSCTDRNCMRPVCVAFKEGYRDGHRDGFKQGFERGWAQGYALGWRQGYDKGFPDGIAACPRPHK
jgi:flagellar biosynthesis/type III secretory pathway protein FliH